MSENWLSQPNSSNSKASDRVQSQQPIETLGFLISLILISRLAFSVFTINDYSFWELENLQSWIKFIMADFIVSSLKSQKFSGALRIRPPPPPPPPPPAC